MKRISFIAILLFALGAMYMVSCQKDQEITRLPEPTTSTETADANGVSERSSGPTTISTFAPCGAGRSCLSWGVANSKVNGITIYINSDTCALFNGPNALGLTYRIYSGGTCANPGPQVAAFKCRNQNVVYAYSSLVNGANYVVRVAYESPGYPDRLVRCKLLTMGYNNGVPCDNGTE